MTVATPKKTSRFKALLPLFGNVIVSTVLYFALRAVGFSEIWSLAIPGIIVAITTTVGSIRRRSLDVIGALVIVELAVSLGLAFVTDDPRIAAIRPALYMLTTGAFFLFTCVVGKPVMYLLATPMATNGGEPRRTAAYHRAWDEEPRFRRLERVMTAGVGLTMFLDSGLRVAIVYSSPATDLDRSFLVSNGAAIVMVVLVVAIMFTCIPRLSKIVDQVQQRLPTDLAPDEAHTP
ncbi:VC0807 family protein [Nocardia brasiliensis]|uniref:VC0807 family protein n=1 Tax=Nocardia brasiliensis TaxID=37326 RepID=UPI003672DCA6